VKCCDSLWHNTFWGNGTWLLKITKSKVCQPLYHWTWLIWHREGHVVGSCWAGPYSMASQAGARINVYLYLAMCWHTRSCTATDGILSNLCTS
jgi:hypothetical protein